MSNDADQLYFSDGISEEIINALVQMNGIKVSARSSSFKFRGNEVDLKHVGEKLGVNTVLEGSIRKEGSRVRVIAQLINIKDGFQIWSGRYDIEVKNVFEVQDKIAAAIVDKMQLTLGGKGQEQIVTATTKNQEAYDIYLRAMHFFRSLQIVKAAELLEQTIKLDPNFAPAYAFVGTCYHLLYQGIGKVANVEMQLKIEQLVNMAMSLDSTLEQSYFLKALILHDADFDYHQAKEIIQKGLGFNPSSSSLYIHAAWNTLFLGEDPEKANAYVRKAAELDPLNPFTYLHLANIFEFTRNKEGARLLLDEINGLFTSEPHANYAKAVAYKMLGKYEESYQTIKTLFPIMKTWNPFYFNNLNSLVNVGKLSEARKLLEDLKLDEERAFSPAIFAFLHLALGDKEETYKYLEEALDADDLSTLRMISWRPEMDELKGESRYEAIINRLVLKG